MGALVLAFAGVCAAATVVAALAAATPSGGETVRVAAGLEPAAAGSAARGVGVWDPTLQRFRDPTADELAVMSRRSLTARGEMVHAEKPQVELRPDGSMLLRVGEQGFGATWGQVESDGTVETLCLHSAAEHEAPAPLLAAAKEEE